MAISLYDLSVVSFQQVLGAVSGVMDRGLAHCVDNGLDVNEIVEARLHPDMLPFSFQIRSVVHHSIEAIDEAKSGVAGPPGATAPLDYAGLQKLVADASAALAKVTPDEVNALQGRDVVFKMSNFAIPFTAENFLMSFSIPNLHFHATTAYDILRVRGVPLGKRDYLGALRIKS